jgi:hypothetical protein
MSDCLAIIQSRSFGQRGVPKLELGNERKDNWLLFYSEKVDLSQRSKYAKQARTKVRCAMRTLHGGRDARPTKAILPFPIYLFPFFPPVPSAITFIKQRV